MADLMVDAGDVAVVKSVVQDTLPAAATILAGQPVKIDSNGKFALAQGNVSGNRAWGIAVGNARAGEGLTAVRLGEVNLGGALAALSFGAQVYLSGTVGCLADEAGASVQLLGRVQPVWGKGTPDKVLLVDVVEAV